MCRGHHVINQYRCYKIYKYTHEKINSYGNDPRPTRSCTVHIFVVTSGGFGVYFLRVSDIVLNVCTLFATVSRGSVPSISSSKLIIGLRL